jgi:cysteine synthase A
LGPGDVVVTICTDAIDRYHSVMAQMTATYGRMDEAEALVRLEGIFHGQKTDWVQEGTRENRSRWHNLKYYTWVEQQGKTVDQLDAQLDPAYWEAEQARVAEVDRLIREARG